MAKSETWNEQLQAAIKAQENAEKIKDLFAAGAQARKALQEMCDNAYGEGKAKISVLVYVPLKHRTILQTQTVNFALKLNTQRLAHSVSRFFMPL